MAIARNHNPGTSPVLSLLLMLKLACTMFLITPLEAVYWFGNSRCQSVVFKWRAKKLRARNLMSQKLAIDRSFFVQPGARKETNQVVVL